MNDLQFARPDFLWLLAVLPPLALLLVHAERKRRAALERLIAARLLPRLAGNVSTARRRVGFALILLGLGLAVVALARPQMGFTWEEKRQTGRDILIAVDTSRSMLANDLQPNRLTRAKLAAQDLLAELAGDRVGLIAFAGSTFLQAPLTADFGAVRDSLDELDTDIIPRGGTNLSGAIKAAEDAFGKGESEHRALIIFSDGEELEADAVAAARANKDKFRIFTVGLGSPEGALIPLADKGGGTDFVRDDQGQYVKSRLDEERMREVAEASGGFYVPLRNGPAEMKQIVRDGLGKMKERESDARFSKQPIERYQWPLTAGIAAIVTALLLGERRRAKAAAGAATAALVLLCGGDAAAKHAGVEKFERKDYGGAIGEFDSELKRRDLAELHFNTGSAAYELGDYKRAAESFSRALGTATPELKPRAAYNFANTLARRGVSHDKKEDKLGDLKEAVRQYDEVLASEPGHADAKHNREIVAKLIEELEKEEKKDEQQKQQQNQQQQSQDNQSQQDKQQQDSSGGGNEDKQQQQQKNESKQDKSGEKGQDQQQPGSDGKSDKEKQDSQGKGGEQGEKKDEAAKNGPAPGKQGEPDKEKGESGEPKDLKPEPPKGEPEKQKAGELKAAGQPQEQQDGKEQEAAEAAEAAAAAQEGRMTEKDASQLLDAVRRFDRRVRLLDPREQLDAQKQNSRPFKNW